MLSEIDRLFATRTVKTFWDGTLGEGGHSQYFLSKYPHIRHWGSDRDAEILSVARDRLHSYASRSNLVQCNYSEFHQQNEQRDVKFDFVLWDLGISSYHLESPDRGFSFRFNSDLDMRLSRNEKLTAAEIFNHMPEQRLRHILKVYGEERFAGRISSFIVRGRPWHSAMELADGIAAFMRRQRPPRRKQNHAKPDKRGIQVHPATRTFQGVRIFVNRELDHLLLGLQNLPDLMNNGGIFAVLSFHSLEDRLVKWFMRYWQNSVSVPIEIKKDILDINEADAIVDQPSLGKILTKKPILPSEQEQKENPRSRSAKLRAFQFFVDMSK